MQVLLLLLFLLVSCTNPPYRGCEVTGADDFVIDSYRIKEGKFAILEMNGTCSYTLEEELLLEHKDLIHEGDLLHIALHHPTRSDLVQTVTAIGANVGYQVREGRLTLPCIEPVCVEGLTLSEAKERIEAAYREQMRDVEIYLSYRDRKERNVELMGMVAASVIPIDGRTRLFEILSIAKVAPQANLFKSYVVRNGVLLPVDLYKLVKEGNMSQNIVMRGGDKIYIADPAASTLMVLGEVNKQRVVDIPNGFMPLRQALAEAGGIPFTGDKRYIQIIRGNMVHPKIYTVNWEHVVRLPTESLLLIPGDIVYVAATPIAEWNYFVNQVLPTLVGAELIMRGSKCVGITLP